MKRAAVRNSSKRIRVASSAALNRASRALSTSAVLSGLMSTRFVRLSSDELSASRGCERRQLTESRAQNRRANKHKRCSFWLFTFFSVSGFNTKVRKKLTRWPFEWQKVGKTLQMLLRAFLSGNWMTARRGKDKAKASIKYLNRTS